MRSMTSITVQQPTSRLRAVLSANAATSLAAGVAGLAFASWWSEQLDIDSTAWTRIVSAALIVFAVDVALAARARPGRLRQLTAAISVIDLAWVAATVAVVAVGALNGTGVAVALVAGVGVLDFALLQLWLRTRMPAD